MNLNRRRLLRNSGLAALTLPLAAQKNAPKTPSSAPPSVNASDCHCSIAADGTPIDTGTSELRPIIERYEVELRDLGRVYPLQGSALRREKLEKILRWIERLFRVTIVARTVRPNPPESTYLRISWRRFLPIPCPVKCGAKPIPRSRASLSYFQRS